MVLTTRQQHILSTLQRHRRGRVDDLAAQFDTTPQTIRKDLARLAELHHVVRFHGGAALLGGVAYGAIAARRSEASAQKRAIGQAVAARLPQGATIFVNAGTTTEWAARALDGKGPVRLITDNVDIAAMTRGYEGVEVTVPPGTVRGSDGAILGAEAVDFLRQFRTDYAVMGAAAMDQGGTLLDYDLAEVQMCRTMMAGTRHVILALDSSKFGRVAPVVLADLGQVHTLVTDTGCPPWVAELCAHHDVDLCIADEEMS